MQRRAARIGVKVELCGGSIRVYLGIIAGNPSTTTSADWVVFMSAHYASGVDYYQYIHSPEWQANASRSGEFGTVNVCQPDQAARSYLPLVVQPS